MEHAALLPFAAWESFYVIVGSSAAALTGLQFVVIVLGAEVNAMSSSTMTRAFGTPTIVHFCAVLLLSAIDERALARAGERRARPRALRRHGIVYGVIVIRHARRQTDYKLVLEDWIWHCTLPLLALRGAPRRGDRAPAPPPAVPVR